MDDFRYAYAVARVNALSVGLLNREFASRILASEPEQILSALGETALAGSFAEVENPFEMDKGLGKELGKAYDLVETICPDKDAIRLFRYRHDFHNLKAILKSQIREVPRENFVVDLCTFDTERLATAVREDNYLFVPEHLHDAALESLAEYERTATIAAISYTCDRLMWRYIMRKARETRKKIMLDLFREYINLANIKTFFRCREFSSDLEIFKRHFIPDGSYTLEFYLQYMDEELGLFLAHLAKTRYERHIVSEGLKTWPEDKSFWQLELATDNFLLYHFHQMRHHIFSIAPLIYYLLRKIADTRLIRTVTRCKLIGMPRDQISQRLRYIYV